MTGLLPDDLVVVALEDTEAADAARLAAELGVPLGTVDTRAAWCLVCTSSGLELREGGSGGRVRIGSQPERHWQVSKRDPLGRAIGKGNDDIVDATAGLGGDTLLLSRMGFQVRAVERSPLVAALLSDRLARAGANVDVLTGDAERVLPSLASAPQVVFLDPMFPPRRRSSALPRKELVALGELASGFVDAPDSGRRLLDIAMTCARRRVVVKRLPESPDLGVAPSHSHTGKVVRYDVYIVEGRNDPET